MSNHVSPANAISTFIPAPIDDGITDIGGKRHMADAKGRLVPIELIKPQVLLEDELVRKIMVFAIALSEQIGRFKGHTMTDLGEFDALLAQEYGVTKKGNRGKGNRSYKTHDGLMEVEVRIQDRIEFGPDLQIAKQLVDECLTEWSSDARPEIRAVITDAFNTDQEGKINRSAIYSVLRLEIEDPRWQEAMRAVRNAMRVTGSKNQIYFRIAEGIGERLLPITIDLSNA